MRRILSIGILLFGVLTGVSAQDGNFKVKVDKDSILLGNVFKVTFTLEDIEGESFEAPELRDFDIVGGPMTSSSMSMINGDVSRSQSYSYILKPKAEGVFFISPAYYTTKDGVLETPPLEVKVAPNPDGIIQQESAPRSFFDTRDFFKEKEIKKPKRKRKIYRI